MVFGILILVVYLAVAYMMATSGFVLSLKTTMMMRSCLKMSRNSGSQTQIHASKLILFRCQRRVQTLQLKVLMTCYSPLMELQEPQQSIFLSYTILHLTHMDMVKLQHLQIIKTILGIFAERRPMKYTWKTKRHLFH